MADNPLNYMPSKIIYIKKIITRTPRRITRTGYSYLIFKGFIIYILQKTPSYLCQSKFLEPKKIQIYYMYFPNSLNASGNILFLSLKS